MEIPLDIIVDKPEMPCTITIQRAAEVLSLYETERFGKLLQRAVTTAVKQGDAKADKNGKFVWTIN